MKKISLIIAKIAALVGAGIFLSAIAASAFDNLQLTLTGAGGGAGATPTLAQVTAVGATTNDLVLLMGGVSTTNILMVDATSTRWLGFNLANGSQLTVTDATSSRWLGFAAASGSTMLFNDATSSRWLGFMTASGTNLFAGYATATGMLSWINATGTRTNLFNLNVSGTIDTASGTGMTCGGLNCRRMLSLSAAGGWPSFTNGAATATKFERPTNRQNIWLSGFYPSVDSYQEWSTPLPNDYDGGTMSCVFNWMSTSTPTFNGVTLGIQGVAIAGDGAYDATWGATSTVTMIDGNAAFTLNQTSSVTMTIGGTPTGAKMLQLRVSRSTANASDTSTSTAALQAVECTYGVNKYTSF